VTGTSISSGDRLRVDDARPTYRALGLVVAPVIVVLVLAALYLRATGWFFPVLIAAPLVLVGVFVALFVRGPSISAR
jgi:multidrug efflux pump subunit AcrB